MKRLTAGLAAIIALTVFACSTPEPERSSRQTDRPEPTVRVDSQETTSATPTLERITFQPTNTPAPPIKTDSLSPTVTRPPDTGPGETSWTDNSQVESDAHYTLIPDNPEFNEPTSCGISTPASTCPNTHSTPDRASIGSKSTTVTTSNRTAPHYYHT